MTHEEAHGKKPESPFEFRMDKEAWDSLKIERDGVLTIKIDEEGANTIAEILSPFLEECAKEIEIATKNSAEIFCRITDCTYRITTPNTVMKYWSLSSTRRTSFSLLTCLGLRRILIISSLTTTQLAR